MKGAPYIALSFFVALLIAAGLAWAFWDDIIAQVNS